MLFFLCNTKEELLNLIKTPYNDWSIWYLCVKNNPKLYIQITYWHLSLTDTCMSLYGLWRIIKIKILVFSTDQLLIYFRVNYSFHCSVGPPPNTKRRQNSLNRLCSVCAGLCCKKKCLCCFVFLDIKIIFIGHSEVTQPPHMLQIHPKQAQSFVLRLCWFVPLIFFHINIYSFIYPSADASENASEMPQTKGLTVLPTGTTDPGDTSESQTTTQLIIIQQTTQMDVTNNTETTTSQSTWLPQTSELTTSELKIISTVNSGETFPAEANSTAYSMGTRLNP